MDTYKANIAIHSGDGDKTHEAYIHWGRVELSAYTDERALVKLTVLRAAFPEPEWKISLTKWSPSVGTSLG